MISTKTTTTALLAALSVAVTAAGAVIPAAFAANANNQVNFADTQQSAKIFNFGISSASNSVGGDFSGGNDAESQTNNFNSIEQHSHTDQSNENDAVSGCIASAFIASC